MSKPLTDFIDLFANLIIIYANRKRTSPTGGRDKRECDDPPEPREYTEEDFSIEKGICPSQVQMLLEIKEGEERQEHLEKGYQYLADTIQYMAAPKWKSDKGNHLAFLLQKYKEIKNKYLHVEGFSDRDWIELKILISSGARVIFDLMNGANVEVKIARPASLSTASGEEEFETVCLDRCKRGMSSSNTGLPGTRFISDTVMKAGSIQPLTDLGETFRDGFDFLECRDLHSFDGALEQAIEEEKALVHRSKTQNYFAMTKELMLQVARLQEQSVNGEETPRDDQSENGSLVLLVGEQAKLISELTTRMTNLEAELRFLKQQRRPSFSGSNHSFLNNFSEPSEMTMARTHEQSREEQKSTGSLSGTQTSQGSQEGDPQERSRSTVFRL